MRAGGKGNSARLSFDMPDMHARGVESVFLGVKKGADNLHQQTAKWNCSSEGDKSAVDGN